MKNFIFKGSVVLILLVLTGYTEKDNMIKNKSFIGAWKFNVPEAPYQYQNGDIIFVNEEEELTGYFLVDGFKAELRNLNTQKRKVNFEVYIQGVTVSFDLTFKKKSFLGTASYSEGTLDISGRKKMD